MDIAAGVPPDVLRGALLIYANGEANLFKTEHVHFAIQVETGAGNPPMFYGQTGIADGPLGDAGGIPCSPASTRAKRWQQATGMAFLRGY